RVFSGTDIHSFVGSYAVRLNRSTEFTAIAGALRAETKLIQTVAVDPVVAALLGGQSVGNVIVHRIDWMPTANARLSRTFQSGVLYVGGAHTVTPGNGLFLSSRVTTVMAGYAYTGLRRWSFNTEVNTNRARAISNVTGDYNNNAGSFTVSRQVT